MKKVLTGNESVAHGARIARVDVIAAYPITPQTTIIEEIARQVSEGSFDCEFMKVESEHSAMAACIGASAAGARTFTATSAQGLALMHELLHWASLGRHPVVLANVNRAMAPGWTIWSDQTDSLSQRDTGWIQFYCSSNQEVLDTVIQAFKIGEAVRLPVMVVLDAFFLSHTAEPVDLPEVEDVAKFLPPYNPEHKIDPANPHTFGGMLGPDIYMEFRYNLQKAMDTVIGIADSVKKEYAEKFGRYHPLVETYKIDDAEVALVTSGTIASTAKEAVDIMRKEGIKVGNVRMHLFRPFPKKIMSETLAGIPRVAVIDRNISIGHHGIFFEELKSALYAEPRRPECFGFYAGLGGRDVTPQTVIDIAKKTIEAKTPGEPEWIGLRL